MRRADHAPSDARERAAVGLCWACAHARKLESAKGSVFRQCGRAVDDPRYLQYPPLPVRACEGYEPAPESAGS